MIAKAYLEQNSNQGSNFLFGCLHWGQNLGIGF